MFSKMHIYVAGIGGAGLGPLAEIAHQMGHQISGSDLKDSDYIEKLRGLKPKPLIKIGQNAVEVAKIHKNKPIDWYVYSAALAWAKPANPELTWIKQKNIKHSKRDEFLNYLLKLHNLKLLAVAGSHGKTTTTAMAIWFLSQTGDKISYLLGGQLMDMPPAKIVKQSEWFIYEADEFDRNFLAFKPDIALITGIDHEHPEVYPTKESYWQAFWQFIDQSKQAIISQHDFDKLAPPQRLRSKMKIIPIKPPLAKLTLAGDVNRQNANLLLAALQILKPDLTEKEIIAGLNRFPGCWRRFEQIAENVYTDYAHNAIKIAGCLERAFELNKPLVVVYEPHSNQRQHLIKDQYRDLFEGVKQIYWLPTFLSREDPALKIIQPTEFIAKLKNPQIATASIMDEELKHKLEAHIKAGDIIVGMSAGDLDHWLRQNLAQKQYLKF